MIQASSTATEAAEGPVNHPSKHLNSAIVNNELKQQKLGIQVGIYFAKEFPVQQNGNMNYSKKKSETQT